MIIKIIRGDNFKGLIDYITRSGQYDDGQDEARILRLEGLKSLKTATAQLLKSASKAPRRTRRAVHILCRAERNLTDAELEETFRRSLSALGLTGRQYVSVVHDDGHGHLGACELDKEGKPPPRRLYSNSLKRDVTPQEAVDLERGDIVSRSWDSHACWRLSKVARELEVQFGLKLLRTGVTTDLEADAGERIAVPDWQLKREGETGLMPLAHELGAEIKAALNLETWEERAEALEMYGLALRAYEGPNARREGIQVYAVTDPTHFCNGSSLGKNYGLKAINDRSSSPLKEWLVDRAASGLSRTPARRARQLSKVDPERAHFLLDYDRYKDEHAQRRLAWSELGREQRHSHRERRNAIKTLRGELLGQGLSKRAVGLICTATRKAMKNEAEARYLTKKAELSAFPPRRMTWTKWLLEEAATKPPARRIYEETHRRITRADQKAALVEAARAKEVRRIQAEAAAAEAREKERRATAAAENAARITASAAVAAAASQSPRPSSPVQPSPTSRPAGPFAASRPAMPVEKPGSSSAAIIPPPPNRPVAEPAARPQSVAPMIDAARAATQAALRQKRQEIDRLLDEAVSQRWPIEQVGERQFRIRPDGLQAGARELLASPAFEPIVSARLADGFARQQEEVTDLKKLLSESKTVRIENGRIATTSVPLAARSSLEPRADWPTLVEVSRKRVQELDRAALAYFASTAFAQGNPIVFSEGLYAMRGVEITAAVHAILEDPAKTFFVQTLLREIQDEQSTAIGLVEKHIAGQALAPVDERGELDPSRLADNLMRGMCAMLVKLPELRAAASKKLEEERLRVDAVLERVRIDCSPAQVGDGRILSARGLTAEEIALLNSPPHRAQAVERIEELNHRLENAREEATKVSLQAPPAGPLREQTNPTAPDPSDEEWETAIQCVDTFGYPIAFDNALKTYLVSDLSDHQAAILFHPKHEQATQARLAAIVEENDAAIAERDLKEVKQVQDLMAQRGASKAPGY
jgi:hypothetical protein